MAEANPSPSGFNGRDPRGRFGPGNKAAKGNPHAKRVGEIRSRLLNRAKDENIDKIVDKLIAEAESGDIAAIREFFDRTIGRAVPMDLLQRIEALEQLNNQEDRS